MKRVTHENTNTRRRPHGQDNTFWDITNIGQSTGCLIMISKQTDQFQTELHVSEKSGTGKVYDAFRPMLKYRFTSCILEPFLYKPQPPAPPSHTKPAIVPVPAQVAVMAATLYLTPSFVRRGTGRDRNAMLGRKGSYTYCYSQYCIFWVYCVYI